jgi:hypothetical protein
MLKFVGIESKNDCATGLFAVSGFRVAFTISSGKEDKEIEWKLAGKDKESAVMALRCMYKRL